MNEPSTPLPSEADDASRSVRAATAVGRAGARAGRVVARRVEAMFTTGGLGFRDLAVTHAASTAGDTLVAIALAGTLFFSVPSGEARGNVALYLLLTVAPFAVIGPALGAVLDRWPTAYRLTLQLSAFLRALLAVVMMWQVTSLWLFPAAFGLLVLSRSHGISRSALLPVALDEPTALVAANARLAQVGVLAGAIVAPVGALAQLLAGAGGVLVVAALVFLVAGVTARRLPQPRTRAEIVAARAAAPTPGPAPGRGGAGRRLGLMRLPGSVRLAQLATAVVRLLNGFLVLLLAFALRTTDAPLAQFGALLGAAAGGYGLATVVSPALSRRLAEEPMVVAALAMEAAAAFVAGQWFGLPAAAVLAAAAGFSWGTAKLAFDGLLQASVPDEQRGAAFTRSETVFQLAWVLGAVLPTALPISSSAGLVGAGLAALTAQVVYVGRLLLDRGPSG